MSHRSAVAPLAALGGGVAVFGPDDMGCFTAIASSATTALAPHCAPAHSLASCHAALMRAANILQSLQMHGADALPFCKLWRECTLLPHWMRSHAACEALRTAAVYPHTQSAKGCGWMGSQQESPRGRFPGVPKVAKDIVAGTCGKRVLCSV